MVSSVLVQAERARPAARALAAAGTAAKDDALVVAAELLEEDAAELLDANAGDLARARDAGAGHTALDRLALDRSRVVSMADTLRELATLPDPVGRVVDGWVRPNGLRIERVRVPLGVVGVIYENRPNVTSDAAGLCLKSGNAAVLRGSSAAAASNAVVARCLRRALAKTGLPEDGVILLDDTSRAGAVEFLGLTGVLDCLVPRGGPDLIATVIEHARVPTIIDGDGNCHVYVDRAADLDMATDIVVNAKTQRPGVCNAAETLLVHRDVAEGFLPRARDALAGVSLVGDEATRGILPDVAPASEDDFAREFLDLRLAVAVVDDLDAAIGHIARYGSGHSEAIVTSDVRAADRFTQDVDAAAVVVNASTRFVDGGELGLGAEIGISTQKLQVRGPMGLEALTCVKYVVRGDGHVRR
jgi:glutamate-5-semialdehyde dehydrogenase